MEVRGVIQVRNALGLSLREAADAINRYGSAEAAIAELRQPEKVTAFVSQYDTMRAENKRLAAEVEALRSALQRLASTEAFALPRVLHAASDVELLMRIDFARAALKGD
jgi:cell division protein FtsB